MARTAMLPVRAAAECFDTLPPGSLLWHLKAMTRPVRGGTKRKQGRPKTKGPEFSINVRLQGDQLEHLDNWIAKQHEHRSRPEAIREILQRAFKRDQPPHSGPHKGASKAHAMARKELDRLGDASVTEEERQRRKRRLLKGPKEFRQMREDLGKRERSIPVSKLNASNDV
jgi:hypothetical protein